MNGQTVLTQKSLSHYNRIDISHLPSGIYFAKFWNDEEVMVRKVVKQ
jgi:hypothetical protein